MQARSVAVVDSAQADPPRGGVKCATDLCFIEPIAPAGDKQVRGHSSARPMSLAFVEVLGECPARRSMQGDPPVLTKFCAADRQHAGLQVDVFKLKVTRFTQTETRNAEQSK